MSCRRFRVFHNMFNLLRRLFPDTIPLETQLRQNLELPISFRVYRDEDFEACVALYRENQSVLPNDGGGHLIDFLKRDDKTLIVAELNGAIVAFGGLIMRNVNVSVFCYGIVSPKYKGYRIGTTLTLLRISQLPPNPGGNYVLIYTLEYSMLFYSRFGFVEVAEWRSGDGCIHPVGIIHVTDDSLHKVKSTLSARGVKADGDVVLQPFRDNAISVTQNPPGRFHIKYVVSEQAET